MFLLTKKARHLSLDGLQLYWFLSFMAAVFSSLVCQSMFVGGRWDVVSFGFLALCLFSILCMSHSWQHIASRTFLTPYLSLILFISVQGIFGLGFATAQYFSKARSLPTAAEVKAYEERIKFEADERVKAALASLAPCDKPGQIRPVEGFVAYCGDDGKWSIPGTQFSSASH